jgi:hypothetical protein
MSDALETRTGFACGTRVCAGRRRDSDFGLPAVTAIDGETALGRILESRLRLRVAGGDGLRETFPEIYLEARSEIDYALQLS